MDLRDYLWLVPALPLAGFLTLVLLWPWADALSRRMRAGQGLPPIWAGWLATALVGAAFRPVAGARGAVPRQCCRR